MRRVVSYLVVIGALALVAVALALGTMAVPEEPPAEGDWSVINVKDFTGKTGYVEGSVVIEPNAILTIEDSTLTVNHSIVVSDQGRLIVKNSTIRFDCKLDFENRFDVVSGAHLQVEDKDGNRFTTKDASVIESATSVRFNFTIFPDANFEMRNSILRDCGRYGADSLLQEGLYVKANMTLITGCNISDGYYGIILDTTTGATVENTTVHHCQVGMFMRSTRNSQISNSRFVDNIEDGIRIQALHHNMVLRDCEMSTNGQANLNILDTSGIENNIVNLTLTGGLNGLVMDRARDFKLRLIRISSCPMGAEIIGGDFAMESVSISTCTRGMVARADAVLRLEDLAAADATVEIDSTVDVTLDMLANIVWDGVTGDLACSVNVMPGATMTIESCDIRFKNGVQGTSGLTTMATSTLNLLNTTLSSPMSGALHVQLKEGSRLLLKHVVMSDVGTSTGGTRFSGVYIAGSGTVADLTIRDSLAGLVVGKALVNLDGLKIQDCTTGILTDGSLGRGGVEVRQFMIQGCDVAVRGINKGLLTLKNGDIQLSGEGFNLTDSAVTVRDARVSPPTGGKLTAFLQTTSRLNLVNSSVTHNYLMGLGQNEVNILWYLNLTLRYMSNKSPLSEATVSVTNSRGILEVTGAVAGVDGILHGLELKERSFHPDVRITTPHTITVSKGNLKDSFGITMDRSRDYTFSLDNYLPGLTITSPEDGSLHDTTNMTFVGDAWDRVESGTNGLKSMRYRIDGGNWTAIALPEDRTWTFNATMEDGSHVVEVEVYDRIGNRNWTQVMVDVDTTPPTLVVTQPAGDIFTNSSQLTIAGRTDTDATVTINGEVIEVLPDGNFSHDVVLSEGENTYLVRAFDDINNSVEHSVFAVLDTALPEVVLDHEGAWHTNQGSVFMTGSKKPFSTLYINGDQPSFFASDRFNVTVEVPDEGLNPVSIRSTDLAGNTWSTQFFIERDTTPPKLVVAILPATSRVPQLNVQGSTDDPDAIITVNGELVQMTGLTFAHSISLVEGPNTVTVEARDELGNEAEANVQTVLLKTDLPKLVMVTPKVVRTFDDNLTLKGQTDPGIAVSIHVMYKETYSKTYTVTSDDEGDFEVDVLLPQIGNHTITVTVEDIAGNQVSELLYFVRQRPEEPPPPRPDGPSWLEDNWAIVILIAAIVASAGIWIFTLSAAKRRRQDAAAAAAARTAAGPDESGTGDEEVEDDDWEEREEADDEDGSGEGDEELSDQEDEDGSGEVAEGEDGRQQG